MSIELRQAAQRALNALDEATTYTGSPSWSPSMTDECIAAASALRAALSQQPDNTACKSAQKRLEAQRVPDEREAFESCALMEGSLFKRRACDPDKYWDGNVQDDWELWQARAILALRPERVPMTPAGRDVIMATRTANADADEWPEPWAYQRGWNDAEAHHGIAAQAKKEKP